MERAPLDIEMEDGFDNALRQSQVKKRQALSHNTRGGRQKAKRAQSFRVGRSIGRNNNPQPACQNEKMKNATSETNNICRQRFRRRSEKMSFASSEMKQHDEAAARTMHLASFI